MGWKLRGTKPAAAVVAATVLSAQILGGVSWLGTDKASAASPSTVKVRLMETTDLHTNVEGYDYFKGTETVTFGLDRTASLIEQARAEQPNNLLVDNGDLIQGTPLGTYMAKIDKLSKPGSVHPMIKVMNALHYDVASLGNHEFNYGLDYLARVYGDAKFPYINANVYKDKTGDGLTSDDTENAFTPYVINEYTFKDSNNVDQKVKVGFIGFAPPQVTDWDQANLKGKMVARGIAETAKKYVPEMKTKGADIVIAMAHSGFDATATGDMAENDINQLSKVSGIDAITFSHSHKVFPTATDASLDASFKDPTTGLPYNNATSVVKNVYTPGVGGGTINGVLATQAGFGGANLGLIDLTLTQVGGKWVVDKSQSQATTRSIYRTEEKVNIANVKPSKTVLDAVYNEHDATIAYTNQTLGNTSDPIYSYFGLVQDDPSIQIVTDAQKWYVQNYIKDKNLTEYKDTPILSAGAPFKAGRNGPSEYTDIDKGPLTIRSANDLYLYDNTLKAVLINGATVKEWLEMSAGAFNQIKPEKSATQSLLNTDFAVFNYDVLDGVTYQIDVTNPAKYNANGTVNDASSSRIVNLKYNNKAIDPNQNFLVVTNNYRASGGGNFPGLKGSKLVVDTQEENRQVLMDYISAKKELSPKPDNNWSIAPIKGQVNVTFTSSPTAKKYLAATNGRITDTNTQDAKQFEVYNIKLSEDQPTSTPNPNPTPKPSPSPTPTPAPGATNVAVAEKDVPKAVNGVVTIPVSVPAGASNVNVQLPLNIADLAGANTNVQVTLDGVTLSIPASVLANAAKLVSAADKDGATVALTYTNSRGSAVSGLLGSSQSANQSVTPAGAVTSIGLAAKTKDGRTAGTLSSFSPPISVTLKADAGADASVTNLYRVDASGKLTYVAAKPSNGAYTVSVSDSGTYAVLTIKRSFSDVKPTHWAKSIIEELAAKQLINGVDTANYAPEKTVTRAEFAKLLVTEFGLQLKQQSSQFNDVQSNAWYAEAVAIAASNGLITGKGNGTFQPNAQITREEMAVMLARIPALKGKGSTPSFQDNKSISSWAQQAVSTIADAGIMQGRGNNAFAPKGLTTRAEAAKVIHSLLSTASTGGGF